MKQFKVGDLVETKKHSFYMTVSEKVDDNRYRCHFGKAQHRNGVFEHRNYAGIYSANELEIYK